MNRATYAFWILLLTFGLLITGCGQVEPTASGAQEKQQKELTPVQVLEKATEAAEKQTGLRFDTTMDQTMEMEADGLKQSMDTNMNMEIQMTRKPFALYTKGTMNMMGESLPLEIYFADMAYYVKNPEGDQWGKMELPGVDKEKFEELLKQSSTEDPKAMLEQLETFKDHLDLTHEQGEYIITLELNDQQSKKYMDVIVKNQLDQILKMVADTDMPADEEIKNEMDKFLKNIKIRHLKQTFHIDEKTFEQTKVEQELTMDMMIEGNPMTTDQKMSMEIKGGVDQITIPEEVKANAVDLGNMEGMEGLGQP